MKTSQEGIDLIKKYEGIRLEAYKALPTEKYYTIGYGHYGPDVTKDMKITKKKAEDLLKQDLAKFEAGVTATGLTLGQNQFDALVSFAYNCGVGNLNKLVLHRTLKEIADAMPLYSRAGGRVLAGLQRRRNEERALFLKDSTEQPKPVSTVDTIAREVIAGKWGNGAERKTRLTKAGYIYSEVQRRVNEILKGVK